MKALPTYAVKFIKDISIKALAANTCADPIKPMAVRVPSPVYTRSYSVDKHGVVTLA
jgi:hypothetical protein